MALIQSVDVKSDGKVTACRNSVLVSHYKMDTSRAGTPIVYSINCASIDSSLLCFTLELNMPSVMIVRPRNEWAYAWYVWNEELRKRNTNRTIAKPMVDLGSEEIIMKVRKAITKCIGDHAKT